jgi:hypothetical protein
MTSRSRILEMGLAAYAGAIFVLLWAGAAYALLVEPGLIDDAWAWLTGLSTVPAIIAWILGLPIGIALWVAQADLAPILTLAVGLGLLAWTGLAFRGLLHAFRPAT